MEREERNVSYIKNTACIPCIGGVCFSMECTHGKRGVELRILVGFSNNTACLPCTGGVCFESGVHN